MNKKKFYDLACRTLDQFSKRLNICEWESTPRGNECLRYYNPCCYDSGKCHNLSETKGCTIVSLPCKLYLCPDAQSKLQRIIVNKYDPLHDTALQYLELRFKIVECCDRYGIPLYVRASKEETFDPDYNEPELSKEWDWINQEVPLHENLDLSTYRTETYCDTLATKVKPKEMYISFID